MGDHAGRRVVRRLVRDRGPGARGRCRAAALGAAESPGATPVERIRRSASGKRLLLILDNCEHVLQASAALADALLRDAPGMSDPRDEPRALARRRASAVYAVAPLALPEVRRDAPAGDIADVAAVRLFADRAQAARTDFAITPSQRCRGRAHLP